MLSIVVVVAACADDASDTAETVETSGTSGTSASVESADSAEAEQTVDVTAACDRLEDLANAILGARGAATAAEVEVQVAQPLDEFSSAAVDSGDAELADLAGTASERFEVYLSDEGIDGREAGNDFDIALDRSLVRCIELGATNDFPEEPTS